MGVIKARLRMLVPFLLIFVAFPLVVIVFGSTLYINTILAVVLLLQLYVIIIQAEITMRQIDLSSAGYEPELHLVEHKPPGVDTSWVVKLENKGEHPALNIFAAALYDDTKEPIPAPFFTEVSHRLLKDEVSNFLSLPNDAYVKRPIRVTVLYVNRVGEDKERVFWKPERDTIFLILPTTRLTSGLVLKSLEDATLAYRAWRITGKIRRRRSKPEDQ